MSMKRVSCCVGVCLAVLLPACVPSPVCGPVAPAPAIDWQEIAFLANLALDVTHSATVSDADLIARYGGPGLELVIRPVPDSGDRYLLILDQSRQMQTIVPPGTHLNNRRDILIDLSIHLAFDPELGINVDTGFRKTARALLADATPFLNIGFRTQLYGYSLGGAVAALSAAYLERAGYAIDRIVTFGQPQLTDASGAAELSRLPLMRFKAARDLVPDVPTAPYRHFGPEVILLDGPFFVYLAMDDPNYSSSTNLFDELLAADVQLDDHFTYANRTASKLPRPAAQVSFCDRRKYIQANVPADEGAPP